VPGAVRKHVRLSDGETIFMKSGVCRSPGRGVPVSVSREMNPVGMTAELVRLNEGTTLGGGYSVATIPPGRIGDGFVKLDRSRRTLGQGDIRLIWTVSEPPPQLYVAVPADAGVIIATKRPRADTTATIGRLSFDIENRHPFGIARGEWERDNTGTPNAMR